jgi:hypothetical protein
MNKEKLKKDSELLQVHLQSEAEKFLRHHGHDMSHVRCAVSVKLSAHQAVEVKINNPTSLDNLPRILRLPIEEFPGIGSRFYNILRHRNYDYEDKPISVFQFIQLPKKEVLCGNGIGEKTRSDFEKL